MKETNPTVPEREANGFKVLLVYANSMMDNIIPVSVSLISACLRKKGFTVDIFDTTPYRTSDVSSDQRRVENLQVRPFDFTEYGVRIKSENVHDGFYKKVMDFKPDLIGLSVVETTFDLATGLLKRIKDLRIPNVVGGVHAIMDPDGAIANEYVEMVSTGEGEELICELCDSMRSGGVLEGVEGLWFKKDGRIIKNRKRQKLVDMDKIPYLDFALFEKERFYKPMAGRVYKMVPIEIARGCCYNCYYCCDHALSEKFSDIGRWYRHKSIRRVFDEINFFVRAYGIEYLYFVSETFLSMRNDMFREFVENYKKIKLPFWFNTRPETITEEKVRLLDEMGCDRVSIGIEHGNEEFRRKVLNRRYSNDVLVKAIEMVKKSRIAITVNNIMGFPGENRDHVFDTINLVRSLNLRPRDSVSCFLFSPFKGTPLRDLCVKEGYIDKDTNIPDNSIDYILKNPIFKKEELLGLMRTFTSYSRLPDRYFLLIRKAEKFTAEGEKSFKELRKIYNDMYFSQ